MTRINVVSPKELSDQWLLAEYRELPRVLKGNFSIYNAPKQYKLGVGHVKWARYHASYTNARFKEIIKEMQYRGFKTSFTTDLGKYITNDIKNDYRPNLNDLRVNRNRLAERYKANPKVHKWTKREKPVYLRDLW